MQRIINPGEIETVDRTAIPRFKQPQKTIFGRRAARLRELAADSYIKDYLFLMAQLADAQQQAFDALPQLDNAKAADVDRAYAEGSAPLAVSTWQRAEQWRAVLAELLHSLSEQTHLDGAQSMLAELQRVLQQNPEQIEQQADAILNQTEDVNAVWAPFIMAALQVYWSKLAAEFDQSLIPLHTPFGTCPCCGSLPVSSIVYSEGGATERIRYASCSLCSTQWHIVRVTCSHCEDTQEILFHNIEEGSRAIKAESCAKCSNYRKIFYQEYDQHVEAVADDLASLELDVLMGEQGFNRINHNPLLWQSAEYDAQ